MGVIQDIVSAVQNEYSLFLASVPPWFQQGINLFLLVLLVFVYCTFVWKFHKFISNKNILNLNLSQYNTSRHSFFAKFFIGIFYFIEYIIILPFIVLLWFSIFTIFLILINDSAGIDSLMLLSAVIIGAIRMISYSPKYGKKLAEVVAIQFPAAILVIYISQPDVFLNFGRILNQISQIPVFFDKLALYMVFIICLEAILRIIDLMLSAVGLTDEED